jgi:hypothetical protein
MSRYDDETILIFFDFKLTTSAEVVFVMIYKLIGRVNKRLNKSVM